MKTRHIVRALATFCVGLMLFFLVAEAEAQRRGGGGRGGGRSISRSGPAMGGSMRPSRGGAGGGMRSRPTSRNVSRSRQSTRERGGLFGGRDKSAQRPSQQPDRGGLLGNRGEGGRGEGGRGEGGREDRPDRETGAERREDWQAWSDEQQDQRQRYAEHVREDNQDFYEEHGGAYYYGGGWGYGGYAVVDHSDDWIALLAGIAIGTTLTAAAYGSMQSETGCKIQEVVVNAVHYYKCGDTWFTRVMDGSNVNYVVVEPPPGM